MEIRFNGKYFCKIFLEKTRKTKISVLNSSSNIVFYLISDPDNERLIIKDLQKINNSEILKKSKSDKGFITTFTRGLAFSEINIVNCKKIEIVDSKQIVYSLSIDDNQEPKIERINQNTQCL